MSVLLTANVHAAPTCVKTGNERGNVSMQYFGGSMYMTVVNTEYEYRCTEDKRTWTEWR